MNHRPLGNYWLINIPSCIRRGCSLSSCGCDPNHMLAASRPHTQPTCPLPGAAVARFCSTTAKVLRNWHSISATDKELPVPGRDGPPLIHSNRYSAASACGHCDGVIRHEPWCKTQNTSVHYAYLIVTVPAHLSVEDCLILHALGAAWTAWKEYLQFRQIPGNCAVSLSV